MIETFVPRFLGGIVMSEEDDELEDDYDDNDDSWEEDFDDENEE